MNKQEISEIRRRFKPEDNTVRRIRGCYVNGKKEIVSMFDCEPIALAPEETEKYFAAFKKTLSGTVGKNLIDIPFGIDQVMDGEEHRLLMALRDCELIDDAVVQRFFEQAIASIEMDDNYLILLMYDAYDVPYRAKDGLKVDDASEEVFGYILCAVCPVKQSKPALRYVAGENAFHARELEWIVTAPETGFLFPAFDDRASNIHSALYYTRSTDDDHESFIRGVFGARTPMPAGTQKELFQSLLEETLGEECNLEVVRTVHEQLRDMLEEQKSDKEAAPLTVSGRDICGMLKSCGVSDTCAGAFEAKYGETFGDDTDVQAVNIVDDRQFELRTPNVVVHVAPQCADLIETRVLDGVKYLLVRADEDVSVNGVRIHIDRD